MLNNAPNRMLLTSAAGLWLALAGCGSVFAFSFPTSILRGGSK